MKKIIILVCLAVLAALLVAVAAAEEGTGVRTVVDMKGKTIELPETIDSYCVLYTSAVPMCAMVDKDLEHMVMYPVSNYFEYWYGLMFEGINDHALQVDKKNVTAEQILESGAQVVFWNRPGHEDLVASLESAGIACVNVQISNADDMIHAVKIIAESFGTSYALEKSALFEEKYRECLDYTAEHAASIPEDEKKTVLVIGSLDSPDVGSIDTYQGYWTSLTGLVYVTPVDVGEPNATLTMEEIYDLDPDIIIAQGPFNRVEVESDPQWKEVRAVKESMLFANPSVLDEWGMPTSEAPLQLIWVLTKFYPEYAGDIDAVSEIISYYKDLYDFDMTFEDAASILDCHHFFLHPSLQNLE